MNWIEWQVIKWKTPMVLERLKTFANGYGTLGTGIVAVGYGVFGYLHGAITLDEAADKIIIGLGLIFVRRAIANKLLS